MKEKVTIRFIAEKAGVSIGAVHMTLTGKSGVGEKTREKIIEIAQEYGYEPNLAASTLKRKKQYIAVDIPSPLGEERYYYSAVWNGIRDYFRTMSGTSLELIHMKHWDGEETEKSWNRLLEEQEIHGVLTVAYTDKRGKAALEPVIDRNLPVFLMGNAISGMEAECCIQPDYYTMGRVMSQLMTSFAGEGGILVYGGESDIPSHYGIVEGVEAYLREKKIGVPVRKLNAGRGQEDDYQKLVSILKTTPELSACCSVNARGSVLLARALQETGRAGELAAIGCELFAESRKFLKEGALTVVLHSNPYTQAYMLCKYMCDFFMKGATPPEKTIFVRSEMITAEALPFYEDSANRILL